MDKDEKTKKTSVIFDSSSQILLVITIIGILAAAAIPKLMRALKEAKQAKIEKQQIYEDKASKDIAK